MNIEHIFIIHNSLSDDAYSRSDNMPVSDFDILYFYKRGYSYATIVDLLGCSRKHIAKVVDGYLKEKRLLRDIVNNDDLKSLEFIINLSKSGKTISDILKFYNVMPDSENNNE